ncbi:DeoR/GlpR family DNA-binding transcription regulator [Paramicrobacterium fandaimingii]|uniref:DeoR/GlpR family DNA-binding transcription regulator n=1 Tax=Paramicrobacterium fandaimingii TaxID=2708079 RepID=UPI0014247079|nr:DeoR/GlpR family DNA-binding transcription regulator [Microbacterium fandaimingii]
MTLTPAAGMPVEQRHTVILAMLERDKRVEVSDLAEAFAVAEETIRRDLRTLEQRGTLTRAHGGAILQTSLVEEFPLLTGAKVPQLELARAALAFVPEQGSIFIDSGETCQSLAAMLPDAAGLQVVTNAVPVALTASRKEHVAVYNLGGTVGDDGEQSGQWTREALASVRVDVAFLSCTGVDEAGSLTASTPRAAAIKRAAFDAATTRVALVHGDQPAQGLVTFAQLSDFTAVFADPPLSRAAETAVREAGVDYRALEAQAGAEQTQKQEEAQP